MAGRKNTIPTKKRQKGFVELTIDNAVSDYFSPIQKGFRFALDDKDLRATIRISRKSALWTGFVATAASLVLGIAPKAADVVKAFHNTSGRDSNANVRKVDVTPAVIQEGARYEFTDANGNKMVWSLPVRPRTQAATQLQDPAPAK